MPKVSGRSSVNDEGQQWTEGGEVSVRHVSERSSVNDEGQGFGLGSMTGGECGTNQAAGKTST